MTMYRNQQPTCTWCPDSIHGRAAYVFIRRTDSAGPGWSRMSAHPGECAEQYAQCMADNGYVVRGREES